MGRRGRRGKLHRHTQSFCSASTRLAKAYFDELDENEQEEVQKIREADYQEQRSAHDRMLHGETASTAEELAERRQHAESISQGALDGLCAQMQCKGVLILGEIIEGDTEVFISMVQRGALPQHSDVDFANWAPVRSKAFVQAFADFLVACKKEEKGLLTALRDQAPCSNADAPALCAQCMASLTPLPPASAGLQDVAGGGGQELAAGIAAAAEKTPAVDGATGGARKRRKGADKTQERRKNKRRGRKVTDTEEEEAEESGEKEARWDGSDAERDDDPLADDEEEIDQLQSSTGDEGRELPFRAKPSLRYQRIVAVGRAGAPVLRKRGPRASIVSSAVNESSSDENDGAPPPARPKPKPAHRRATGDTQPAAGTAMDVDSAPR
ncbi:hypothetical protein B0H14DRAFT_3522099 [Mycena olivaceomarginata]|nr:hypothetical protein B0H14DRAFT_3522099 [Mycena olivaceomarginata]